MNRNDLIKEYDDWYRRKPHKWTSHKRNQFMLKVMRKYQAPTSVLDVGCGNGHTLAAIQGEYPDAQLYAMDISQEALALTNDKVSGAYLINEFLDQTEFDTAFDWVICMGVAEHFENLEPSLARLKELTGGFCYLEIPHCLSYSPGSETFRRLSCGSRQWEWHLTRETWEQLILAAGFEFVEVRTGNNPAWEFVYVLK